MKEKLFNKNYILLIISATLFYTAAFMINSVCAKYSLTIGADKTTAGITTACFTLSSFFTRRIWGYLTDKKGRKVIYYSGGFLCMAASVILIFTDKLWTLFLSRLIFGSGYSALTTAAGTIVCDVTPQEQLNKGIAFYGVTNVLSQAVAPAVALWLFDIGFKILSICTSIIILFVIIISFFINYQENEFLNENIIFRIVEKRALPAAYVIIFFAAGTASVNSFVPVMAQERKTGGTGLFFVVSAFSMLISRVVNVKLQNKTDKNKLFFFGAIVLVFGYILLTFSTTTVILALSAILYGLGCGFVHPIVNTAAMKNCPSEKRGLATGTFMMSQDLGMTIGAAMWGFISEKSGFTAVYLSVCGLMIIMIWVYRKFIQKNVA